MCIRDRDWNKREEKHHEVRRRITEYTYNNMAKHKGIGVNEVSTVFSFYAPSVSYTHLDVYKRQNLYSSKRPYFLPVIFSKSLDTSKITCFAFLIASACKMCIRDRY